jgi:hypothetical protein
MNSTTYDRGTAFLEFNIKRSTSRTQQKVVLGYALLSIVFSPECIPISLLPRNILFASCRLFGHCKALQAVVEVACTVCSTVDK